MIYLKHVFLMLVFTMTLPLLVLAREITTSKYSLIFKNYDACFILYSLNDHRTLSEYSPNNRCNERIAADSTFKIAISLMAFDQGIIDQNTVLKWDGIKRSLPDWNHNQTPESWLKYSVVWVSQQLTPQLGLTRIKHYLAAFNYGNQDFSGDLGKNNGLTHAWLSSSLKISAMEQLSFLNAMLSNQLSIIPEATANTKKNLYQGKLDNGADYYGKTGSGKQGELRDGWFIGFIENGSQQYIFVSNLTDKVAPAHQEKVYYGSQILKPIAIQLLNDFFAN